MSTAVHPHTLLAIASDGGALRREPKQARSRARLASLLDAAEQLLEREGPDALSTTRIAAEAGVSVGSLYQYFPDKETIVDALARRYLADFEAVMVALVRSAPAGGWRDPTGELIDAFAGRYAAQPGYRALWLGRHLDEDLRAADRANKELLAEGIRELLVGAGLVGEDPALLGACRTGVIAADALLQEAFRLDPAGDPDLLEEAKRLLRCYLTASAQRFPPADGGDRP